MDRSSTLCPPTGTSNRSAAPMASSSALGVTPLGAIDTIVTDVGVNQDLVLEVEAAGPNVVQAGQKQQLP